MRISAKPRISSEQLTDMSDQVKENLVTPINQFNEQVFNALCNSITVSDNMLGDIRSYSLTDGVTTKVRNPLSIKPVGAVAINTDSACGVFVRLGYINEPGQITLTAYFQIPATTANVTVWIIGG